MTRLEKFCYLPPEDQWLLLRCLVLVALIRLGLSTMKVEEVRRRVSRWAERNGTRSEGRATVNEAEVEKRIRAVRMVSRIIPGASCLTQALAAQALLARIGFKTQLRLGVMRRSDNQNEFRAHAWVERESDGRVILGHNDQFENYTAFAPIEMSHQF